MLMNLWGSMASAAIVISYIPQLLQTFRTRNVEGQNLKFWLMLTFSVAYFFVDAVLNSGNLATIFAQLCNLLGAGSMLLMVQSFSKPKREK